MMGFNSPIHWIVVLLIILLLFGSGRLSSLMGDMAKGIKSFKKGMADDDDAPRPPPRIETSADIRAADVRAAEERDGERFRDDRG